MSILSNVLRHGNFSSSEISDLLSEGRAKGSKGDPYYTYIAVKNMERRLKRSIQNESDAKPLQWGKTLEIMVHQKLGIEYKLVSDVTIQHPEIDCWVGSPDGSKQTSEGLTVTDIKNPLTLKSFCQLVDPFYVNGLTGLDWFNAIRNGWTDKNGNVHKKHKDAEAYFYQLISNGILIGAKFAELIIHVPYYSELEKVRQYGDDIWWIKNGTTESLPWLPDNGLYKDISIIRFEIPEEEKTLLTSEVLGASKFLTPYS